VASALRLLGLPPTVATGSSWRGATLVGSTSNVRSCRAASRFCLIFEVRTNSRRRCRRSTVWTLVHCAGVAKVASFEQTPRSLWLETLTVNVVAAAAIEVVDQDEKVLAKGRYDTDTAGYQLMVEVLLRTGLRVGEFTALRRPSGCVAPSTPH
jgi:hypothetical protein